MVTAADLEGLATSESTVQAFIRTVPDELFQRYVDVLHERLCLPLLPDETPPFVVCLAGDPRARKRRVTFERALTVGLGVSAFSASTRKRWLAEAKKNPHVLRAASRFVESATERMVLDPTSRVRGFVRLLATSPKTRRVVDALHRRLGEKGRAIIEALTSRRG